MKLKQWNSLNTVKNIQRALKVWNTRTLTLEGILVFKTLGISKIVYLCLIITVANSVLNEIQKAF